jgi:hypothetical protein
MSRIVRRAACCAAVALLAPSWSSATPVFIAPNGLGGYNGYEVITATATLPTAFSTASGRTFPGAENVAANAGVAGHVITIRSAAQNAFVNTARNAMFGGGAMWIGLSSDPAIVPGAGPAGDTSGQPLPPAGQAPVSGQRGFGFKWQSGESFTYQNWSSGEPNNFGAGETGAEMVSSGQWNDNGPPRDTNYANVYVIEYNLNLASRPTYNMPAAQAGKFNVRMFYNTGQTLDSGRKAQALFRTGGTGSVNTTASVINFKDPDNGGGNGAFGATFPRASFPGDTPGDTEDFAMIANGIIRITTEADYTFGYSGDDGGALRIIGGQFSNVTNKGDGGNAQAFGDTLAFDNPTGDSNVLGVMHLTPGDYPLEFEFFERAGGAFTELYAAQGVFSDRTNAAFHLIGDTANGGLELVAAPEPSTMGLAAVAALGLLRRRRGGRRG